MPMAAIIIGASNDFVVVFIIDNATDIYPADLCARVGKHAPAFFAPARCFCVVTIAVVPVQKN